MKRTYQPDPRPEKRVRNAKTMKDAHARGCFCVLNCGAPGEAHHVLPRSQRGDDLDANLVCLCAPHHHSIHAEDLPTKVALGEYLLLERADTVAYLRQKTGSDEWLRRRLLGT